MSSDRQRAIEFWSKRSHDSLLSAQRDFEAGACSFAVSRLYYASFYAVSALLLKDNLAFRRHSGVRAAFHQNFVKTGKVSIEWGKFYDRLFEDRQEGDYVEFIEFEQDYVDEQIKKTEEFLRIIQPLLEN